MKDNYKESICLKCIVCGSDDCFEGNDVDVCIICTCCNAKYPQGCEDLITCNQSLLDLENGNAEDQTIDKSRQTKKPELYN